MKKRICTCMIIFLMCFMMSGEILHADEITKDWNCASIAVSAVNNYRVNTDIVITPEITGEKEGLTFKYVWQKDNWKEWAVLKEFSTTDTVTWTPTSSGNYTFYVDIKDQEGNVVTKTVDIQVNSNAYQFSGISTELSSTQKVGEQIALAAEVSGDTDGLSYKFVWQKDNWKEWGVLKAFGSENEVSWTPQEKGKYTILVDVRDSSGKVRTYNRTFEIKNYVWEFEKITFDKESPIEKKNLPITIEAVTSGEDRLLYKYVWMKDNWKEWGVLQNFSNSNTVQWNPKAAGEYTIFVDVKDLDGKISTKNSSYTVLKNEWKFEGFSMDPKTMQHKGEKAEIKLNLTGDTDGLSYKFVWQKDNWKSWGVLQNFSEKNSVSWKMPNEIGKYTILVDVKDEEGAVKTFSTEYYCIEGVWSLGEIKADGDNETSVYTKIPLELSVVGEAEGVEYYFEAVHNESGKKTVIQQYSKNATATWYPKEAGKYTLIGYAKDQYGLEKKIEREYTVKDAPWKLEEIVVEDYETIPVGGTVNISANVSGEVEGLQFKYVWMKDNWKDWGVLREFGDNEPVSWTPEEAGKYNIYLDIKDARGVQFDAVIKEINVYSFEGVKFNTDIFEQGVSIQISPNIVGDIDGAKFKYVWAKEGWAEWGVIADFTTETTVEWTPEEVGNYIIYIDMQAEGQKTVTKSSAIKVATPIVAKLQEIRKNYEGAPYKYGGSSPSGWDCSGFTQWVLQQFGISIPRSSSQQAVGGTAVNPSDVSKWKPGDIICYANNSGRISHVAIYLGNGELMHALNSRVNTVIHGVEYYEELDANNHRVTVRRYLK